MLRTVTFPSQVSLDLFGSIIPFVPDVVPLVVLGHGLGRLFVFKLEFVVNLSNVV